MPEEKETFVEKYGLQDQVKPTRVSQQLQDMIGELFEQSDRIIRSGEYIAKVDKTLYKNNT